MADVPWLEHACDERFGAFRLQCDVKLRHPWTVLFGPSGTGKSTWLRILAGLFPQRTGFLRLQGTDLREVPVHQRRIALVEQSPALFPHHNVAENVRFARAADAARCDALMQAFHLKHLRSASIRALSGGERQRVAIARALASCPKLLLLDEVFTGMDAALQADLITVLREYSRRESLHIISVTHDIAEVFVTADEVLRMNEGRIVAQGGPADILREERAALLQTLSA